MVASLNEILRPQRVVCKASCGSKKRVIELIAGLVAGGSSSLEYELLDNLNARERLGSTGLGHGIAIPHCRMPGVTSTTAVLVTLDHPVDYGAIDDQPVDLLFALIVPEDATDEHLQLLSKLAELFSEPSFCGNLRRAVDADALYQRMRSAWNN